MKRDLNRRLIFAKTIARAAGEALLVIRDMNLPRHEEGDQLKSAADLGAEALLTTLLKQHYPDEAIIAEENNAGEASVLGTKHGCWIVDPLDGTRSYHDGFDGFCVQLAYVEKGIVRLGVVYQPVGRVTYFAIRGRGAFREEKKKKVKLPLRLTRKKKIYIDSRRAKGAAREALDELHIKKFLECGSFGVKLCKIAEGSADVFLKDAPFKLWDVAPAEVILNETGCKMTLWNGKEVRCDGTMLGGENLLAASLGEHDRFVRKIKEVTENKTRAK
jgi:fructose-1,6-bisphosphatase/inositol monophosphatase family enzyme